MVTEKKSPKFILTVLMPVYNTEKFLDDSIGSILEQTYTDFEFLILDDGSTDNSLEIIEAYAKEDKRIKILVNQKNQGEAKCRNRLLKNTKTKFIAWMDADDISLENRLQSQMDYLKQNPSIDAVGNQYSAFGGGGNQATNFTSQYSLSDIEIKTNFIFGYDFFLPSSLMRMKKIKQYNLFFDSHYKLSTGVDHQYIIDCFPFMKFSNLNKVLYQYRQHAHQITVINQKQILDNAGAIIQKHLLRFNIKADSETIHFFLQWIDKELVSQKFPETVKVLDKIFFIKEEFNTQKFQKVLNLLNQLATIKNFYNYARIEKNFLNSHFLTLLMCFYQNKFLKNNKNKIKIFEDIFKKYLVTNDLFALKQILENHKKSGLEKKLFFIKTFRLLDNFKPFLTVLMPVYNAEKFLDDSIGSILEQTYTGFEFLILDDGSTDNSLEIIKAYAKKDERIKVLVNKTNQKQAKCRNRLLKNTKTEFIAWMDADDISLENRLQIQMDYLKQNSSIDAVGTQYSAFGGSGNQAASFTSQYSLSDIEIKTSFIFGYDFLFGSSLMRMKKIKQYNIFFDSHYKLSTGEDHQYIIDCFPFMKFSNLKEILYQYRQDSNQTTTINQKQILDNAGVIIQKHLLRFNIKADLETIHFFLQWIDKCLINQKFPETVKVLDKIFFIKEEFDTQKFQKVLNLLNQLVTIKNFYNHARIEKIFFIPHCLTLLLYFFQNKLLKKNSEKFKEFFKNIFRQYPITNQTMILRKIYYHYRDFGLGGKLFFIKNFGFKSYLQIKYGK